MSSVTEVRIESVRASTAEESVYRPASISVMLGLGWILIHHKLRRLSMVTVHGMHKSKPQKSKPISKHRRPK
jgi:hypothetical protein